MVRRLIAVAVALLFAATALADDARTQRLEKLCRVWAAAKYTHPAMLTSKVDWDGALVRAIPGVRAATTPAELASAIAAMLKELGDPVTRVVPPRATTKRDVQLLHQDGDTLVIDAGPYIDANDGIAFWNIGYVDLRRLTPQQVGAMFDALMKTKAIVFDMRRYPNGTAWQIAPRINTRHAVYGASFRRAQLIGGASAEEQSSGYYFDQPLPKTAKPLYTGKVVVLIDNRAISQAEHSCLFFEQAAGETFIGSPTAGANGDVTSYVLPGGLAVRFSGHDVRHVDGRQLQRVGIQPDIRVEPTIAGLRAGKDEVLDRAIAYVNGNQ